MAKRIGQGVLGLVGLYFVIALALVFWPGAALPASRGTAAVDPAIEHAVAQSTSRSFKMRDGVVLRAQQFGGPARTVVLMLHGVGASSRGRRRC